MNLDVVFLLILLVCILYGIISGFLRQLVPMVALIIGVVAAWLASYALDQLLHKGVVSAKVLQLIISTAVFFVVYFLVRRKGKRMVKARAVAYSEGIEDRLWGGLFGLLKGIVTILIVIWIFDCLGEGLLANHKRAAKLWNESRLVYWARRNNMIANIGPMRQLRGFFISLQYPASRKLLEEQPAYERMIQNLNYQAFKNDDSLSKAISGGRWAVVVRNSHLRALLADGSFWRDFSSVDWTQALGKEAAPPAISSEKAREEIVPVSAIPTYKQHPEALSTYTPSLQHEKLTEEKGEVTKIYLKNGSIVEGKISRRTPSEIVLDIFMNGGVVRMNITTDEIERIEESGYSSKAIDKSPTI
jgi:uncharacterized membrane protein required for colicin V production